MDKPKITITFGEKLLENEIKVNELENDILTSDDYLAIEKLVKRLKTKHTKGLILGLLFILLFGVILYDYVVNNSSLLTTEFLSIIFTVLVFSWIPINEAIALSYVRGGSYKKAKHGIVETKYYSKGMRVNNRRVKLYYTNVLFTYKNQRLRKVRCDKKTYHEINEGSRVLVVSFNDKVAHVISV